MDGSPPSVDEARRMQVLYEVSRAVLVANRLEDIAERALDGLNELVGPWRASVVQFDRRAGTVTPVAVVGRGRSAWPRHKARPLSDFGGDMKQLEQGRVDIELDLGSPSARPDAAGVLAKSPLRSRVITPVQSDGRLIACLCMGHDGPGFFTDAHIGLARELSSLLGAALTQLSLRDEMHAARAKAEKAADFKSAFLANMSHEIRTPLNAVIGLTGVLLARELPDEDREIVGAIRNSGEALLSLVSDVLDFSKIEAGRMEIERRSFELGKLLEQSLDIVTPSAREKGLALEALVDDDVPRQLVGDDVRLRQVLSNLLSNAVKFTGDGGRVEVRVSGHKNADERLVLRFAVNDTGIGIPPERLARIFDDFSQADASTTRRFGGTGLGLAITRRLIRLMGGDIRVTSRVGKGTSFMFQVTVEIGAQRPDGEEVASEWESGDPDLAKRVPLQILVAEDNPVNRMVACRVLEQMGYEPHAVTNGREAVEAIDEGEFDLVLMDIQMPEMDGVQAARAIVRQHRDLRPVIVALTASAFTDMHDECLAAGMDGFITKPLRLGALRRTLEELGPKALRQAHLRRRR